MQSNMHISWFDLYAMVVTAESFWLLQITSIRPSKIQSYIVIQHSFSTFTGPEAIFVSHAFRLNIRTDPKKFVGDRVPSSGNIYLITKTNIMIWCHAMLQKEVRFVLLTYRALNQMPKFIESHFRYFY